MKEVVITGDRPTGKLHLGHYVGSLRNRKIMQDSGKYDMYIFSADMQGLTDNAKNPEKIKENVFEVIKDNLSIGIDPEKVTIFVQSGVPELTELTTYYLNLVTLSRLKRNPTVKEEIKQRGFEESISTSPSPLNSVTNTALRPSSAGTRNGRSTTPAR